MPYPVMTIEAIKALPVGDLAAEACHLWLWTTNQTLHAGFHVMAAWGFTYMAPIHWIKPSGFGNYWVHRSQTLLFGYKDKCLFPKARYKPNIIEATPGRHSEKPVGVYQLAELISPNPRLELFAREKRPGWDTWGNETECAAQAAEILGMPRPLKAKPLVNGSPEPH